MLKNQFVCAFVGEQSVSILRFLLPQNCAKHKGDLVQPHAQRSHNLVHLFLFSIFAFFS